MASKSEQLLVVVSILEGRHFPKRPRLSLVVQAGFEGEQLATDPVDHSDQPQFSTELAWELDHKTLRLHRLQRTPIKLQCFAVDLVTGNKECVGYIVLDLRSVHEVKQEPRWYPLLSSKYTKQRPALLLSTSVENDTKPSEPSPDGFRAKKALPRRGSPALIELPEKLEAVLVPDQGFHQIGPPDLCSQMFVLSVTVAFATKLEQLIPSTRKLSSEGSEFFFYYSLLGNDITSEPFCNLLRPEFEPERASVRIRSSKQVVQSFLAQQPSLQIHLCCGTRSLGSTHVSVSALSANLVDLESKAATVEGVFVLQPSNRARQTLTAVPADLQPTVGVSVTLRREEVAAESLGNKRGDEGRHSSPSLLPAEREQRANTPPVPPRTSDAHASPPAGPPPPSVSPPASHTESEAESLHEELQQENVQEKVLPTDLEAPVHLQGDAELAAESAAEAPVSSVSVSAPKVVIPSSAHHYCFSLDLCSLRKLSLTHPIAATLRYSYPFFGSAAPIMTNPPVELQRNMEVHLPQSYCTFNFAVLPQQLQETFLGVPLVVELWHRDSNSRDELIGRASLQLSHLLSAARTLEPSCAQTHQAWIPVTNTHREKVAELFYVSTLEDLGSVKAKEIMVSESSQSQRSPLAHTQPEASKPTAPLPPPTTARDTLEYRTALELELWKEEQQRLFDQQLQKKEWNHFQMLSEEWKAKDREREALVKKKEMEYNLLEEQLQKTLSNLEKQEKQQVEEQLKTQKLQMELQESSRRLKQDCDHRVMLERDKVRLMEEERARLLQQLADADARYKQLEKEFQLCREQQNSRPEFRLQAELNLLNLQKVELERKLETTTKSKLHYKQQWGRALKELARFKQVLFQTTKILEHMVKPPKPPPH